MIPWDPTKDDLHRFSFGDCHLLAHAIHSITGWPIMKFGGDWHAFVRAPDGRYLDVKGVWERDELLEDWRHAWADGVLPPEIHEVSWENISDDWGDEPNFGLNDEGQDTFQRADYLARELVDLYEASR